MTLRYLSVAWRNRAGLPPGSLSCSDSTLLASINATGASQPPGKRLGELSWVNSYVDSATLRQIARDKVAWAHFAALVHYRAGNRERALALLKQSSSRDWYGLPLESLLAQQAGDDAAARKLFDAAFGVAAEYEASLEGHNRSAFYGKNHFFWWYDWATFLTMLREAEQTIRGKTTQDTLEMHVDDVFKD